jgi:hypothetical protein
MVNKEAGVASMPFSEYRFYLSKKGSVEDGFILCPLPEPLLQNDNGF